MGVVCALRSEARHLGPFVSRGPTLAVLADGTLLSVAGVGGAAATLGAAQLVAAGAAALVSFGMAGGLDPALPAGTIFLPAEVLAADGTRGATDPQWRARLAAALSAYRPQVGGALFTSTDPVTTIAAKAALLHSSAAAAVDMESAAVAQVAHLHRLPFVAVRVIVDVATDALPDLVSGAADASGKVHLGRLIARLLARPSAVVPLTRLARRYREANRALARVARSGVLAATGPAAP